MTRDDLLELWADIEDALAAHTALTCAIETLRIHLGEDTPADVEAAMVAVEASDVLLAQALGSIDVDGLASP